jgi:uncharacterized membrane protein YdjX (TVP38/TMEM64 family)
MLVAVGTGCVLSLALGIPAVALGATLGACASFLITRYCLRSRVEKWIDQNESIQGIANKLRHGGFKFALCVRLVPLVPFTMLNYAMGLTSISFSEYFVATFIGMLPGCISNVYIGASLESLDSVFNSDSDRHDDGRLSDSASPTIPILVQRAAGGVILRKFYLSISMCVVYILQ